MADFIRITASLQIERPVDDVRAQYRDIDHHIRNNVHPSIRYRWEPAEPGQRKIRTTFRILGVPQFDVSLLEDAADGSFVIRYLEGSNAGMVLVHRFVPVGDGATDVRLTADAPGTLARKLLGPLFVVGARQVMKKALAEDKRDLEGGAFEPGRAAGNVEVAFAAASSLSLKDAKTKRAVLDAACLISAVDGDVDPAEKDAIGRLARVLSTGADMSWVNERLAVLPRAAETEMIGREIDRIGRELWSTNATQEGLSAAAAVALVSHGMSLGELTAFRRLAIAAGVNEDALGRIVDAAETALATKAA